MKADSIRYDKLDLFRAMALGIAVAGALGSLDLTLKAGYHNKSFILVALFVAWVESPLIVCVAANIVSARWSLLARLTLYSLMTLITIASLIGYSGMLYAHPAKPAAVFLILPFLSWILMVVAYLTINFGKTNKMQA